MHHVCGMYEELSDFCCSIDMMRIRTDSPTPVLYEQC